MNVKIRFYIEKIKSFIDLSNYDKEIIINWLNNNKFDKLFNLDLLKQSLTIFEHKMADNLSIPTYLINNTKTII
jgi:PhoPQ-activated pathogenicity-related protein